MPQQTPVWPALAAAVGLLALGQAVAATCVLWLGPPGGSTTSWLPPWAFAAAWTLLYPCLGLAAVTVWRERPDLRIATTPSTVCALAVVLAWMPITCAAQHPWVTVAMDVLAWLVLWVTAAGYARVCRTGGWLMLPLVVWMPVTSAVSAAAALAA